MKLVVNGAEVEVDDRHAKSPLLWVLVVNTVTPVALPVPVLAAVLMVSVLAPSVTAVLLPASLIRPWMVLFAESASVDTTNKFDLAATLNPAECGAEFAAQ